MAKKKQPEAPADSAVIYARFSSHNQREESIDAQVRACKEYAEKKGLQVVEIYTDSAKTGTNTDREGFQQMLGDSAKGKFRYLIVHKLDRFSRDVYDSEVAQKTLKVNGVTLLSAIENLDGSPESNLSARIFGSMNQFYSENLAREVMKGMKESAYKATHLGGTPPLGYDVNPERKYVINEPEAQIVRAIFTKYADGVGYDGILRYLNGRGFKTKRGNAFGNNSLYSILENEKYVGTFVFNKKLEKDVSGKRNPQWKPKEEWIIVENAMPAIVDKETFAKVQAKMEANARRGGRFKAREIYLLSGLVYCGECGFSMYGNTRPSGRNKTRYSSYRCSNRANHKGCSNKELRKEYVDNFVLDRLYDSLFSDCAISKLADMLTEYNRKKAAESNDELSIAKRELEDVNQKIRKVVQLVSESGVSIDTVKDEMKKLEERKLFVEAQIREISRDTGASMITDETIIDLINRSKEFVQTRNIPECRNFIDSYVGKVIIYGDKVEIQFKIHVPDGDDTISPLTSGERIKALQNGYRQVV